MGESITAQGSQSIPLSRINNDLKIDKTGQSYVLETLTVTTDADPGNTTIYTVPSGKTFWLTRIRARVADGAKSMQAKDKAGDDASGDVAVVVFAGHRTYGFEDNHYSEPVPFKNGITFGGNQFTASKAHDFMLEGILV